MLAAIKKIYLMFTLLVFVLSATAQQMDVAWGVQLGTSGEDFPKGVATDPLGNCYVVGQTDGALAGDAQGSKDMFVIKLSASGEILWKDQVGTSGAEDGQGIAVDSEYNVYAFIQTNRTLGEENFGRYDMVLRKYNADGDVLWTKQFGSSGNDYSAGIKVGLSNQVYLVGRSTGDWASDNLGSTDVIVATFDSDGQQLWLTQFGSSGADEGRSITFNASGDVFVVGQTMGSIEGQNQGDQDGFFAKLNSAGELQWVKQFGTSSKDQASGIALDGNSNIYIGGWTYGKIGDRIVGGGDAYLGYFDSEGEPIWIKQFGTGNWDGSHGMATIEDGTGDVLLGGCWQWPACHGWVRRYNTSGELVWEKLIYDSPSKSSCGQTVAIDPMGDVYHVGGTDDNLFTTAAGQNDAWAVKISSSTGVAEPRHGKNPDSFQLNQNYPNPFNPSTKIDYSLQKTSHVRLIISNTAGQVVKTLVDDIQPEGVHDVVWDAKDEAGQSLSSGIYFCQLSAGKTVENIKMILMR